ncbi:MAG: 30S ribosomal protein S10 [Thermoproteota archaeon]|jgi:small subunit ribosomal protein S10|nr:30S ribosomal protein S10 [Thermoproteota archaeon]
MPRIARIFLTATNVEELERVAKEIKELADSLNARVAGPIPLPTKRLRVVTRKTPCGDGTHTFDRWELRIHKRVIDVLATEYMVRQLARIKLPPNVKISINIR